MEIEDEGDRIYRQAMEREANEIELQNLYHNDLGFCGCGRPDDIKIFLRDLLKMQHEYRTDKIDHAQKQETLESILSKTDKDVIFEILMNVLDKAEIMEHGSSVYGSKLTEKGATFYKLLDEYVTDLLSRRH